MNEGSTAAVTHGAVGTTAKPEPLPVSAVATAVPAPWCSAEVQAIAISFFFLFFHELMVCVFWGEVSWFLGFPGGTCGT